eukprot:GFYU01004434.1.p1 GENE.GFYU01004434.1~~GFYU01004434.1.p1  ORF type:complete len:338 (-),score=57.43 GFYU01004434.1:12-1025(-)
MSSPAGAVDQTIAAEKFLELGYTSKGQQPMSVHPGSNTHPQQEDLQPHAVNTIGISGVQGKDEEGGNVDELPQQYPLAVPELTPLQMKLRKAKIAWGVFDMITDFYFCVAIGFPVSASVGVGSLFATLNGGFALWLEWKHPMYTLERSEQRGWRQISTVVSEDVAMTLFWTATMGGGPPKDGFAWLGFIMTEINTLLFCLLGMLYSLMTLCNCKHTKSCTFKCKNRCCISISTFYAAGFAWMGFIFALFSVVLASGDSDGNVFQAIGGSFGWVTVVLGSLMLHYGLWQDPRHYFTVINERPYVFNQKFLDGDHIYTRDVVMENQKYMYEKGSKTMKR